MSTDRRDALRAELLRRLGPEVVAADPADRRLASSDASRLYGDCLAVLRPRTEEETVAAVRAAVDLGVALTPRGAGTSPTGSAAATPEQAVLDFARMNRIVDVDARDLVAVVEPGVLCGDLQARCEALGLFYPPDPASSRTSTLGGNVATCAGGLRAVKYGVTRDYVLGLRAVLGTGEVLEVGGRHLKSVVGYDLVRLFVGSEGTLGAFTRLTLKLLPKPEACETVLASFADEAGALAGADAVLAAGVLPRALEYLDRDVLEITAGFLGEAPPAGIGSRLLVEVDGDAASCGRAADRAVAALSAAGAVESRRAADAVERDRLWRGRRAISPAVYRASPAKRSEDLGVPRSRLAAAIAEIKAVGRAEGLRVLAYGHAGDANLHVNFLYDPARPGELERLRAATSRAVDVALAHGGTVSGEHGVGLKKLDAARRELSPRALALMRGIKTLFDPRGVMNPGKAIPEE
ncbi:MAG TPA: FAD-linked oxidase C-terminal domain-containing protein [Planctomycetota bacterium]|nr:FAD-linked oxidase C-terminal domain-containing protein [Planctomycetota bacterium]